MSATNTNKSNTVLTMFDDGFSINMQNMEPYKMYEFEYKGTTMWIKKTEDDNLELFSE